MAYDNGVGDNTDWHDVIEENSRILRISPDVYLKIVSSSIVQGDKDVSDLELAINKGDYSLIQTLAHRLKGVYGNLRLDILYRTAEAIDIFAKQQDDIEKIKEQFSLLKKAFLKLKEDIS